MNDFFKSCLRWQMAFCLALGIAFAACNDDNNEGLPDDTTPQHSFEVADFTPIKGPRDTEVTLNGKNFGTDKESVKVFLMKRKLPLFRLQMIKSWCVYRDFREKNAS